MSELDRRDFLKLVGASAGAAAAAGCSDPIENLVPYVVQPESITPGIAEEYSSTCQECSTACGLRVKTREGRPIKLEGNPENPINRGRLCARGQGAIARSYHPDRYQQPMKKGKGGLEATDWNSAQDELVGKLKSSASKTWVIGGSRGPTIDGLIDTFVGAIGAAGNLVYEPFAYEPLRSATKAVFGVSALPIFDLSSSDLVIDFGSDFMDTWLSPVEHSAQIADARDVSMHPDGGTKVISIGPRLTLTGGSSDQWIAATPGSEGVLALALAEAVIKAGAPNAMPGSVAAAQRAIAKANTAQVSASSGVSAEELAKLAKRLIAAKQPVVLPPGVALTSEKATSTAAAVLLLDALLGAVDRSVVIPASDDHPRASMADMQKLIAAMNAGQVDVLLIHDANPLYSMPASSGFAAALAKVGTVVSFASLADETAQNANLVLPDHTPLESWGDAHPRAGVRSIVQPTLRPLWDTQAIGDTLLVIARALGAAVPEGSFRSLLQAAWEGTDWRQALDRGGLFTSVAVTPASIAGGVDRLDFSAPKLEGNGDFTLVAFPHSFLGDGSSAALPWMQETPDPVTKVSWDSWAELSLATAKKLGVDFGDVVTIQTTAGTIEVSVLPRGGIRDDVVAVAIGQGHSVGHYASRAGDGMEGVARGASVISVLPARTDESGSRIWLGSRASVKATGRFSRLPLSQWSDNQRGRNLAKAVPLSALAAGDAHHGAAKPADAHAAADAHGEGHGNEVDAATAHGEEGHEILLPYEMSYDADPNSDYRWGMTIDTDRCNGCSACVSACAIENNIPVVGQDGATRHREMTWIRIERYNTDGDRDGGEARRPYPDRERLGETDVRHAPMLCQQCGAAPCEAVCPTLATYHSVEGLNGMIYNRCIGTRYCANNCTYKVRRFNYFDYSRENWPGLLGLMLNPDVTVRGQGVMEKCTFCVQRIEAARQPAKDAGVPIADGAVQTACQQTCPSGAISFGNSKDDQSQVVKKAADPVRAFHSLQVLNTRPAITYLAKVDRETEGSH